MKPEFGGMRGGFRRAAPDYLTILRRVLIDAEGLDGIVINHRMSGVVVHQSSVQFVSIPKYLFILKYNVPYKNVTILILFGIYNII